MFTKNLSRKILSLLFLTAVLPLILVTSITFVLNNKGFSELNHTELESSRNSISAQFEVYFDKLLVLSKKYAANQQLIDAVKSGDQEKIASTSNDIFTRLKEEHDLEIFEIGNFDGVVLYRAHNPAKHGDNKSDDPALQLAAEGKEIAGFNIGSSGLNIRAFVPIQENGKTIGTLQTGLDDTFLQNVIKSVDGVGISLYDDKGTALLTTEEDNNQKINKSIFEQVASGKSITEEKGDFLYTYMPLFEPTNTHIIGIMEITEDISNVNELAKKNLIITAIVLASTLLAVIILSILFSRSITRPVKQIVSQMKEISEGNLEISPIHYNGKDEIKTLSDSVIDMKDNLLVILESVAAASKLVQNQSEHLNEAAHQVKEGSVQIATTMQELSAGTESQAHHTTDLAEKMELFRDKINNANSNGDEIADKSHSVLAKTKEGTTYMQASVSQMSVIDSIVQNAITKVNGLDEQANQISLLIEMIQDIANQTNLLALNAAIEAARAGEHGKGFAVVATEVRKLAEQVSVSVNDITTIVTSIQGESAIVVESLLTGYEEVNKGKLQIETTGKTFNQIEQAVTEMAHHIQDISTSLKDLNHTSISMTQSIEEIASISEESAAGVEQVAASAQQSSSSMEEITTSVEDLTKMAEELSSQVNKFRF
ncbi:methyl-accepting chemotaxis protein [Robertmurraya sp. Marseille-Q9965]